MLFRREQKIVAKMAAQGRSFIGVRAVMGPHASASSKSRDPRRGLNPRVTARSKWQRIEAIQSQYRLGSSSEGRFLRKEAGFWAVCRTREQKLIRTDN
jgi:hypothetical protein